MGDNGGRLSSQSARRGPTRRLGALRHRNYALYFAGQIVSQAGNWMQSIALSWLALQLTHSPFKIGMVVAAQFAPALFLSPIGGLVADRFPRRRILFMTQALSSLPALSLFVFSYTHQAQFWMVLVAAAVVGSVNSFDVPTRQSFMIELVGREDLLNAIALNSTIFNTAAVVGPSLAGLIIATLGVPLCFLANAISPIGSILALALMRDLPRAARARIQGSIGEQLRGGLAYARATPAVGFLLVVLSTFVVFAMNRQTLMPIFADEVLRIGPSGYGLLIAAMGAGALAGAVSLASLGSFITPQRQFWVGLAWAATLGLFSLSRVALLSAACLFLAGLCQIWFNATSNSRIQAATPDSLRGRVMGLYAQAMMGTAPLGAAQSGVVASLFGAPVAMLSGAVMAALVVLLVRLAYPDTFRVLQPPGTLPAPAPARAGRAGA